MPRRPSGNPPRPGPPDSSPDGLGVDGLAYDDSRTTRYNIPPYQARDPLRRRRQAYDEEPHLLRPDPVVPTPASPLVATPVVDPLATASPTLDPAGGIRISQTTTTTNPILGVRSNVRPTDVVIEETFTDPEIGPSVGPGPTARAFGVHIRATPVDPLRPGNPHRPPPYPADTNLAGSTLASGLDARTNMPRREVRFADQERLRRLRQNGRLRNEDDVGEGPSRGDI